ncbi:MAG: Rrf2 family transcriptional regulator [Lachnospiraceae bacterium]|nr:Rrf2 family transcriptional regulator [Lachnospiraceae bacterium]
MKISTKGRYALRLMLDMAQHREEGYISLRDVSERQNVTLKYLEQIVPPLVRERLIASRRGATGGYRLARDPSEYTVGEILQATEGKLVPVTCMVDRPNRCGKSTECLTLPFWNGLGNAIDRYVNSVTLEDILRQNMEKLIPQ